MSVNLLKDTQQQNAVVIFVDDSKKFLNKWNDPVLKDYAKAPLENDFNADYKESLLVYTDNHPLTQRLLFVGVGKKQDLSLQRFRILGAEIVKALRSKKVSSKVSVFVPKVGKLKVSDTIEALQTGADVFQFEFNELKGKKPKKKEAITFNFIVEQKADVTSGTKAQDRAATIAEGVNWGRRLVQLSPRQIYPETLAKEFEKMLKASPSKNKIKLSIWDEAELKKKAYGGILAVAQGSDNPPRFIIAEYRNGAKSKKPVALVGKGVTFDSGGLSLKPPPAQETMKYDMAGAASVMAAFKIVTDLQVKTNLVMIVPTVENMPSGKATRPGDVITMASGKTVEVLNTDAEGRLILADALYHATEKMDVAAVIDVATLTGACALAVADAAAGYFGNNQKVKDALHKASEQTGEYIWPLPDFDDFYVDLIKSDVADIRNIGKKREAGATTAALFLEEFVHNDTPWTHLDIAGCGWYDSPRDFVGMRGASGVPMRLLAQFVENFG